MIFLIGCGGEGGAEEPLRNEVGKLREELTQRGLEKSNIDSELGEVRTKFGEVEREKDALKANAKSLQNDRDALRNQLNERAREKETLQTGHDSLKTKNADLVEKLSKFNDPLVTFKRNSRDFIKTLGPRKLFGSRKNDQFVNFKQKMSYLTDARRLIESPMLGSSAISLPLPLVFDIAPKPKQSFTVYVSRAQGVLSDEETAKFILATDDKTLVDEHNSWPFNVPEGFPILYLGKRIFLLPKVLLNPLYASNPIKLIPLQYQFDTRDVPLGYDENEGEPGYLQYLATLNAQIELAKSTAAEEERDSSSGNGSTSP